MLPRDGSILLAAGVEWLLLFGVLAVWIPGGEKKPLESSGFRGLQLKYLARHRSPRE